MEKAIGNGEMSQGFLYKHTVRMVKVNCKRIFSKFKLKIGGVGGKYEYSLYSGKDRKSVV